MKSIHFFISVFVLNFIFAMDIASANYENKISNQESVKKQAVFISNKYENEDLVDAHRVTPLSPKKDTISPFLTSKFRLEIKGSFLL